MELLGRSYLRHECQFQDLHHHLREQHHPSGKRVNDGLQDLPELSSFQFLAGDMQLSVRRGHLH
jgi:hypothetical protein